LSDGIRLRSPMLAAALAGATALQSGQSALRRVVDPVRDAVSGAAAKVAGLELPAIALPHLELPALPAFSVPAFLHRAAIPAPAILRGGFVRRPSGLVVPPVIAAPCADAGALSGAIADRIRPGDLKPGAWAERVDLAGLARFLTRRHPEKTAYHVAAETGLPADTVKKYLRLEMAPGFKATIVLVCTYGPELLAAMLSEPPEWLDPAMRQRDQAALTQELAALSARIDRVLGVDGVRIAA
jgi:hypothetical protein